MQRRPMETNRRKRCWGEQTSQDTRIFFESKTDTDLHFRRVDTSVVLSFLVCLRYTWREDTPKQWAKRDTSRSPGNLKQALMGDEAHRYPFAIDPVSRSGSRAGIACCDAKRLTFRRQRWSFFSLFLSCLFSAPAPSLSRRSNCQLRPRPQGAGSEGADAEPPTRILPETHSKYTRILPLRRPRQNSCRSLPNHRR